MMIEGLSHMTFITRDLDRMTASLVARGSEALQKSMTAVL